jgi:hypothetical protein
MNQPAMRNGRVGKLQLGEEIHHTDEVLRRKDPCVGGERICCSDLPRIGADVAPRRYHHPGD